MSSYTLPGGAPRNPPFRAEHVGSFLRPQELVQLRYDVADGKAPKEELKKLQDQAIKEIIELQHDCGFHAVGDGEYRRNHFWSTLFSPYTMNGMKEVRGRDPQKLFFLADPDVAVFVKEETIPNDVLVCVDKISHTGKSDALAEFEYVKSLVPQDQVKNIKITSISPSWFHFRYAYGQAYPREIYPTEEDYFEDVARAYRTELKILYDAGCRNIQIDDPNLAYFCDKNMLAGWGEGTVHERSADAMFDAYMKFYNKCFERPEDMHLGIHLCRGNYKGSRHFSEGAYDRIAKQMFNELNVNTFYLEYDTPRAGGFEPLKFLPKNKNVVLGVITSKFPKLEDKQEMIDRIHSAADMIAEGSGETREEALKRVSVSPQCGFASIAEGNSLGREDMKKKLQLVRSIADAVWPGEP